MPPTINAFLPNEWVIVADKQHLQNVLARYRNGSAILEELIPHIGERLRIVSCSFPHGAGVLYKLSGVNMEVWQECLIDSAICDDDGARLRASAIYKVRSITEAGETFVVIEDKGGRAFAKLRRLNHTYAVSDIAEIASLRSRIAFEIRFNFDGDYANTR